MEIGAAAGGNTPHAREWQSLVTEPRRREILERKERVRQAHYGRARKILERAELKRHELAAQRADQLAHHRECVRREQLEAALPGFSVPTCKELAGSLKLGAAAAGWRDGEFRRGPDGEDFQVLVGPTLKKYRVPLGVTAAAILERGLRRLVAVSVRDLTTARLDATRWAIGAAFDDDWEFQEPDGAIACWNALMDELIDHALDRYWLRHDPRKD